VEDNVRRAAEMGLKEIAITDHGLSHIAFGLSENKVYMLKTDIEEAKKKYPQLNIYCGVESNILGVDGTIDLVDEEYGWFDIILCGYHKFVWPLSLRDYFRYFISNYFYDGLRKKASPRQITRNTDAYINAITKNPIDVLTHINFGLRVDCKEVAKAAKAYGTYMELNGKRISFSPDEFWAMAETGVEFIINSDAHSVGRIADFSLPLEFVKSVGYPPENIVNYGKKPSFRGRAARTAAAEKKDLKE